MRKYLFANTSFLIGAGMLVAAFFCLLFAVFTSLEDAQYDGDGATVRGQVVGKRVENVSSSSGERRPRFVVVYTFTPPSTGIAVQGRARVSSSVFNSLEANQPVDVEYLVADPSTNRLTGAAADTRLGVLVSLLAVVFGAVGSYMVGAGWRAAKGLVHLRDTGVAHRATVTDVARTNTKSNQQRNFELVYVYEGPEGETLTGKSVPRALEMFDGLKAGDEIDIVVDVTDPTKSAWQDDL
ncbi:MAG: DUF3592 domain-containing protein [Pseudomonadota bacterium]